MAEARVIEETVASAHRPVLAVLEWAGDWPARGVGAGTVPTVARLHYR